MQQHTCLQPEGCSQATFLYPGCFSNSFSLYSEVACKQLQKSSVSVSLKQSFEEIQAFNNLMVKQLLLTSLCHLQILMNVQDLILVEKAFV